MSSAILRTRPLGFPWETQDPFLFCVHHDDAYPKGNEFLGPDASLKGRNLGMDFEGIDGWRMYHGTTVPGFPGHPHRGFETVTIARRGYIDHSDSLGAAARFGQGDVQWLTAGEGIVHSEMFPLLQRDQPNPVELFQIWLNLPAEDKLVKPHFAMLWDREVPRVRAEGVEVTVIAGSLGGAKPPPPPPKSWAARADTDVAIWCIKLQPGAKWTLPHAAPTSRRTLYFFKGSQLRVDGQSFDVNTGVDLRPEADVELEAGNTEVEALLLQGKPIAQPVAQHGPFVMNTREELVQAMTDLRNGTFIQAQH